MYLDSRHVFHTRVRDVKVENDLRTHLLLWHNLQVADKKKSELAKLHLLAHTIQAFPQMRELLNLPEGWGKP